MRYLRMLVIVAIMVGLGLNPSGEANASSYAYTRQELTNFRITVQNATLSSTSVMPTTTNNANLTAEPSANHSAPTNALEAYVDKLPGSPGDPGENVFTAKGTVGPSWVRSDTLISTIPGLPTGGSGTSMGSAGTMRNVAEGFLSSGTGNANASAVYNISYTFTATNVGPSPHRLFLQTDWSNEVATALAGSQPGDLASGSFLFQASLTDHMPVPGTPAQVQLLFLDISNFPDITAPLQGNCSVTTDSTCMIGPASGTVTSSTGALISGHTYSLTLDGSGTVTQQAQQAQPTNLVPEPGTLLLLGSGLFGLVGFGWRARRYGSAPTSAGANSN